jgi:hypothetical protein
MPEKKNSGRQDSVLLLGTWISAPELTVDTREIPDIIRPRGDGALSEKT